MNELTPQQTFEQKVKDRLREQIGDLIPDDLLAEMVKRAIQDSFFERVKDGSYGTKPSFFVTECHRLIRERLEMTIRAYFDRNGGSIAEEVAKQIRENAPQMLARMLVNSFSNSATIAGDNIAQRLIDAFHMKMQQL